MYLLKDKKAVLKYSFLILTLVAISAIIIYAVLVSAATHTSTVTVDPSIVAGALDDETFTVTVCNDAGSNHNVHEFRIYYEWEDFTEFTDVDCKSKTDWYGPIILPTTWGDACWYSAKTSSDEIKPGECTDFEFTADSPGEECCRELRFETRDTNDEWMFVDTKICVDATDPETTKRFEGPQKKEGDVEWIDGITEVVLEAEDPEPHPSGVDKTWYINILAEEFVKQYKLDCDPEKPCWDYEYCQSFAQLGEEIPEPYWHPYEGPFKKEGESCHVLFYYSEDEVGNKEKVQVNCFFVDTTAPKGTKEIGDPNYGDCEGNGEMRTASCTGWDCLGGGEKDFFVTGRADPTNWDMAIWNGNPEQVEESGEFAFGSNQAVPFSVSYDPNTGKVVYNVGGDGSTLTWNYDLNKAFEFLVLMAKGASGGCDTELTNLEVNGNSIGDVVSTGNYQGLQVYLSDSAQTNGFVVTGNVKLIWESGCKKQEIPAFHVFAMNTHNPKEDGDCWVRDDTYMAGTPITLECTDQEPHPSGDEEVCFRVSYDIEPWLTEDYCKDVGGSMEGSDDDDYCCVDDSATIIFHEDSLHDLEYFCRDAVGKESEPDLEYFRVDSLPPVIEKDMFGSHRGDCPPEDESDVCYVADDGTSGVDITVYDDDTYPECFVDGLSCYYDLIWIKPTGERVYIEDGYEFGEGGAHIVFTEDSEHELYIYCEDALGNSVEDTEYFKVDSTPPETEKGFEPDAYMVEGVEWIDTAHEVVLKATDEKVGVDKTYYKNKLMEDLITEHDLPFGPEEPCWHPEICASLANPELVDHIGPFDIYEGPFKKEGESCHVLWYYSVDKLGNVEDVKTNCFFVDKTPPNTEKDYEGPIYPGGDVYPRWIDGTTKVVLYPEDPEPHPSGVKETYYRVTLVDDKYCWGEEVHCGNAEGSGEWQTYTGKPFGDIPESCHLIEYYSVDNVGKVEDVNKQCVFVDKTGPTIKKTYSGPQYPDPITEGTEYPHYIDSETTVVIDVEDTGPHKSGLKETKYKVTLVDDKFCGDKSLCESIESDGDGWTTLGDPSHGEFGDIPESCHVIEIYSEDNVGKSSTHKQCVFVDHTPPNTEKWYEGPVYPEGDVYPRWIDGETLVVLEATDPEPHPSGVAETKYRVTLVDDKYCWGEEVHCGNADGSGGWKTYTGAFGIDEESCHLIEYYAVDNVDKTEDVNKQCVFVDKTPPEPLKEVGEPKEMWDGKDSIFYPEETANCWKDGGEPHCSGAPEPDSCSGYIENQCTAVSGCEWTPEVGAYFACEGSPKNCESYVDQSMCSNAGCSWEDNPTPSCYGTPYECSHYYSDEGCELADCDWVLHGGSEGECTGTPDSCGVITDSYKCDKETPGCEWITPIECWRVTLDTPIILDCEDQGPHPSDHETTCFNVEVDGVDMTEHYCEKDEINGDYNETGDGFCCGKEAGFEFHFQEETEHNLKYYCVDAVEKKGDIDEEKFKVLGRMFEIQINKKWNLISVPFDPIDKDVEKVFDDIVVDDGIDTVWTYDNGAGKWKVWRVDNGYPGPYGTSNLEEVEAGLGYWVLANCEADEEGACPENLLVGGSLYQAGPVTPPLQELGEGWNLIGYYGTEGLPGYYGPDDGGKEAYCALYSLRNLDDGILNPTKWSGLVSYWEPDNPYQWEIPDENGFGLCDQMDPGAGYWIAMDREGNYNPQTVCDEDTNILDLVCMVF